MKVSKSWEHKKPQLGVNVRMQYAFCRAQILFWYIVRARRTYSGDRSNIRISGYLRKDYVVFIMVVQEVIFFFI